MNPAAFLRRALCIAPFFVAALPLAAESEASVRLAFDAEAPRFRIAPEIHGQFAEHLGRCIYGGLWVEDDSGISSTRGLRTDVVTALRELEIPVLRWPGGCFADDYHWRDGIGPREERPAIVNTTWGGVVENNHFGTHEFFELVRQLDTKAYVAGNVGSGTVREMQEWVEYMTSPADSPLANLRRANGHEEPFVVDYFGVGNENWGCGGNMRVEYYADVYRHYSTFIRNYGGPPIYRVAGGSSGDDLHWTEVMMERAAHHMEGLSLHYYTLPTGDWSDKGPATGFDEAAYFATLKRAWHMNDLLDAHGAVMDAYDPEKRVGLIVDEWGVWTNVEPGTNGAFLLQQNSMRDAIVAALHFNFFHAHADRVHMANIAQMVNVLQAMVLTDGPRMLVTPTYWVFHLYKVHQGAEYLPLTIETPDYSEGAASIPQVSATASRDPETGKIHLSLVNCDPREPVAVELVLGSVSLLRHTVSGRILTAETVDAHNTFDEPNRVIEDTFDGARLDGDKLQIALPPLAIVTLELE